jgi:predicted deacylase
MGRFELNTSENFNRHYPDFCAAVLPLVQDKLGSDAAHNVRTIRQAASQYLQNWVPETELASQRKTLTSMAFDADVVLDLHCDCEAIMHMYAEVPCWPTLEPLARLLGTQAVLLAKNSGGLSFDECMSGLWWQLADKLGNAYPIPQACCSTTVELRGEAEVGHALAQADADAIFAYLQHLDVIGGTKPVLPALGDLVCEVIDPIGNTVHALRAEVPGVMYARTNERYATPGDDLANIAGAVPFRTGNLLGA